MLTLFAIPKPFRGHIGVIQRNAINSWVLLQPRPEIILFGGEEGTEEIGKEFDTRLVPKVARNEYGTPLFNDLFEQAQRLATYNLLCYVNADIILMSDFIRAIEYVKGWNKMFVLAGAKRNINITNLWDFSQPNWEQRLRALAEQRYSKMGVDYFVFPCGFFVDIPPLTLGRWTWDGWLLWKARSKCGLLIDATPVIFAIHQNHDYSFIRTNGKPPWLAEEAMHNLRLAGNHRYWYLYETTHCLTPKGIKRLWFQKSIFRVQKLLIYRLGAIRHTLGLRRSTLHKIKHVITAAIGQIKK